MESFHVDDFLAGAETTEDAITLQRELRNLLLQGGFDLRKWRSSSEHILQQIKPELLEKVPVKSLTDDSTSQHPKALGIVWDSCHDHMSVSVDNSPSFIPTKRGIISDIAYVLGWIAPSLVMMKILLQRLWELKLAWDNEIPVNLQEKHLQWRTQLQLFKSKHLDRCYFRKDSIRLTIQLHGFSDASEDAYATVVYIRATYVEGPPTVTLVVAKTKVAPLK